MSAWESAMGIESFSWMESSIIERFSAAVEATTYFYVVIPFIVNMSVIYLVNL